MNQEDYVYQIDVGYACAGIVIDKPMGTVIEAAPIFRWMVGKSFEEIVNWVVRKNGTIKFRAFIENWYGSYGTTG